MTEIVPILDSEMIAQMFYKFGRGWYVPVRENIFIDPAIGTGFRWQFADRVQEKQPFGF